MQKAIDNKSKILYIKVAKRERRRVELKKYRELVELKGILRERKISYENLAENLKMSLSAISNKINGKSVFDILEAKKICEYAQIPKEKIPIYFF